MILDAARAQVAAVRADDGSVVPDAVWTFAAIPGTVLRLLTGAPGGLPGVYEGERFSRIVLVLLDAFGWAFLERHASHPFARRLLEDGLVCPLTTQFPSQTTAHVTTICSGLPVREHGLYEWNVYEPSVGAVIMPLVGRTVGAGERVDVGAYVPASALLASLAADGRDALALLPAHIADSPYSRAALTGAERRGYGEIAEGAALASASRASYTYVYWDRIDTTGHLQGPSSDAFDEAIVTALDALAAAFSAPAPGTLLLLCADHGQIDVSPQRVDYVDAAVDGLLSQPIPAGSARDMFLHTHDTAAAVQRLREALGDRAAVHATADVLGLFGEPIGPRLRERLGDVCVLPAPGRMVWLQSAAAMERYVVGHHGGLTPAEAETFLAALPL